MPQIAGNQHNPNRSPFDDYPTHPDWTHALLDTVPIEGPLWEPAEPGDTRFHWASVPGWPPHA